MTVQNGKDSSNFITKPGHRPILLNSATNAAAMTDPKKALKRKNTHFADDILPAAKNSIDLHKKSAPVIPEPKPGKEGK